jgi:cytochrome c-type biogenesis protein
MRELIAAWYGLLSALSAGATEPVNAVGGGLGVPLISALLFGLVGALSPCQLTTGAGALAYIARAGGDRSLVARRALAYALGKSLVYTLGGGTVLLVGQQLAQRSVPVMVVARQVAGPLMLVLGLYLLGLVPLRFTLGHGLTDRLERRAGGGTGGAFLLGVAFAFTFCPTLFLLFFGLTIPLALRSPLGLAYPVVFALGTTAPLLLLASLFTLGRIVTPRSLRWMRRLNARVQPAAAVVLLLVGLNDTVLYWFM